MEEDVQEFTDEDAGLRLRAVFMPDLPIQDDDAEGGYENQDTYIWFAASTEDNAWFAFALSDEGDDPETITANSNLEELRRFSIFMGLSWEAIEDGCPHCVAQDQRERYAATPLQVAQGIMEYDLDELRRLRSIGEWEAFSAGMEAISGLKLSLN